MEMKTGNTPAKTPVLQWHPAFYAGMQIEFEEEADKLIFENEHHLGTKPKQIDVLIIKKNAAVTIRKNIGRIFRKYNIVEYKSPEDYLSIDDFYRVYGYACFYKADAPGSDSVKSEEITITFVCRRYPRKLICHLKDKYQVSMEQYEPGIYYMKGTFFAIQFIVTSQISEEKNFWLRNLTNDLLGREKVQKLVQKYEEHRGNGLYQSVMDIIVRSNYGAFKEEDKMCQALVELMHDIMHDEWQEKEEKAIQQGMERGMQQGMEQGIRSVIEVCKGLGMAWEGLLGIVQEKFDLTKEEAERYMELYW